MTTFHRPPAPRKHIQTPHWLAAYIEILHIFTDNLSSHTYCCYLCVEHGVALPAACDRCSYSYIYRCLNMESLSWITDDRKQLIYKLTLSYCTNRYQEPGTCHSADGMLFKNKQKTCPVNNTGNEIHSVYCWVYDNTVFDTLSFPTKACGCHLFNILTEKVTDRTNSSDNNWTGSVSWIHPGFKALILEIDHLAMEMGLWHVGWDLTIFSTILHEY